MRKTALTTTILILFLFSLSIAQENSCDQTYIKAMTAKDATQKAKLLKDFLAQAPQATVYAMLGNDDWQCSYAHLKSLAKQDILRILHGEKHDTAAGYELIGYVH